MLATRVEAGELPPLEERLPEEPVVVEPLNRPGQYGGTLRGTTLHANATSDLQTTMVPGIVRFSHDLVEQYPDVAESFTFNDDYTRCTVKFRRGMKWSDGEPFTADDMMFYFEGWQFNEELSPVLSPEWVQNGERMQVSKVDDYTVQFDFAIPMPAFSLVQRSAPPAEPYIPKHFADKFHPEFNSAAEDEATSEGFENWQDRFLHFVEAHYGAQAPERPDLAPWVPVEMTEERQRYERNPYYWKVDTDGRQLPYIDEVVIEYVSDLEVTQLRTQSGEVSVANRDLALDNYPLLKESEEAGDYRATLLTWERGAEVAIAFNQEHKNDRLRRVFTDVRFRQAVSVAIDREEINKLIFLEQGTPRQATVNEEASFYKPEWGEHYAQFDPDLANSLLDEIGLDGRNDDGLRLHEDGRPLRFQLEFVPETGPIQPTVELVVQYWRDVGLDVRANPRDKSYMETRLQAGEQDASVWQVDRQLERSAWAYGAYWSKFRPGGDSVIRYAAAWRTWFDSGGEEGTEPPDEAKALQSALEEWQRYEMGTPEYEETAVRVHDLVAETLWVIGIVGQGPAPAVVKNGLENVLGEQVFRGDERVWTGAANWYWLPHRAEQWFFTDGA